MQNNNKWSIGFEADIQGLSFSCSDYREICQGGPRLGNLMLNDVLVKTGCCGPFIHADEYIYLSVMERRLMGYMEKGDFRICRLHIFDNRRIEYLGIPQKYIELIKLCDNKLFHYHTIEKDLLHYTDINCPQKSSETDTPLKFRTVTNQRGITVEYVNLEKLSYMNICIGNMKINGRLLPKYKFGAPFLYNESMLIAPVFKEKFWQTGFNIARIDLSNYNIQVFPMLKKMFYLESFINDIVYYYDDMDKSKLLSYSF
jgi:hypothetical protein